MADHTIPLGDLMQEIRAAMDSELHGRKLEVGDEMAIVFDDAVVTVAMEPGEDGRGALEVRILLGEPVVVNKRVSVGLVTSAGGEADGN